MAFWGKVQEVLDKGIDISKDVFDKVSEKAKELGEKGKLNFELFQLESQVSKKLSQMGAKTYELLMKEQAESVTKDSPGIKELVAELLKLQAKIDEKETALKTAKK